MTQRHIGVDSDPQLAAKIRLLLAWCYLESNQFYEAAVLCTHVAMTTPKEMVIKPEEEKPSRRKDKPPNPAPPSGGGSVGAELVNAAISVGKEESVNAISNNEEIYPRKEAAALRTPGINHRLPPGTGGQPQTEYLEIVRIAELIHTEWPDYEKADDIRLFVAQLHGEFEADRESARWFQRVSVKSPARARSQLAAGQIYNSLYLKAARSNPSDSEAAADNATASDMLRDKARQLLQTGIKLASADSSLRDNLMLAKLTLAQLALSEDQFDAALALLTNKPNSLLEAVGIEPETERPTTGIKGGPFATAVYETLARTHLGNKSVQQAVDALSAIDEIAETLPPSTAALYLQSCELLAEDFGAAESTGDEQMQSLTTAALILQKLVQQSGSLSPKAILDTAMLATGLAERVDVAEDAALLYTAAADLYAALLEVVPEENKPAIRYRMAIALRPAGRFEQSFEVFEARLQEKPNVFDAQIQAAETLQAWGAAENDLSRLQAALDGLPDKPHIWGWRKISSTLQKLMNKNEDSPEYQQRFLAARNSFAKCRLQIAMCTVDKSARKEQLQVAATEVKMLATRMQSASAEDLADLNATYGVLLQELGQPPDSLIEDPM